MKKELLVQWMHGRKFGDITQEGIFHVKVKPYTLQNMLGSKN